jgi:hypothetical protein
MHFSWCNSENPKFGSFNSHAGSLNFKVKGYNLNYTTVLIDYYFMRNILVSYQYKIYPTTVPNSCGNGKL